MFPQTDSSLSVVSNSKESVSHVPQQSHADTFVLPPIIDNEHAHDESSSYESFDSEDLDDPNTESVQLDAESMHEDADAEPEQRPKWTKTTLQDAGDLVGDPVDTRRTQYNLEEPPLALTSNELMP
jgi:hypothetical protein